ncbi:MAG TPA: LuxR C-terminal-related transcriptional regulator, partial [Actinomycetota bacterium]|nr:LuxR C-terminal-related transcriptional regulator [Actinomycetota bacterium]
GERYRYHPLLQQLLRADLDSRTPGQAGELLVRAAEWSETEGHVEDALTYAREVDDAGLMSRVLERHALRMHRQGRDEALVPWFAWFEERDLLERYPIVAVIGAWLHVFHGRAAAVQRWAEAAERGAGALRGDDRVTVDTLLGLLQAASCRNGPERMERDAREVLERTDGDLRGPALLFVAVAKRMRGDGADVDTLLVEAVEEAVDRASYPTAVVALSERAILAIEQEDWLGAAELAREAAALVQLAGLEDYVTSGLLYAVAARIAVHVGDLPRGRLEIARAHRLRSAASHAMPFLAAQVRLELANAYLAITDSAGARTMLRELELLFTLRRDLGVFRRQADEVHARASSMRTAFVGGSSLTTAELRLLPLLATHHSFREIADRLFVSRHTVKTQAISIYRKLRVTSRSEAVDTARDNGLLAATAPPAEPGGRFTPMG